MSLFVDLCAGNVVAPPPPAPPPPPEIVHPAPESRHVDTVPVDGTTPSEVMEAEEGAVQDAEDPEAALR